MNDIKYVNNNYQFIYRVAAIIYNKDKNKILLFKGNDRDFYMLPGGKVHEKELSVDAIKRKIKEEIGYDNLEFKLKGLSEELVNAKGYDNHQITLIYETVNNMVDNFDDFKSIENDWINFKWINIDKLNNYTVFPKEIISLIYNDDFCHLIDNN